MKPQIFIACVLLGAVHCFTIPLTRIEQVFPESDNLASALRALKRPVALENRSNVPPTQMQYRGELSLGSPPKPFSLIFDTGSSWLWVTNVTCGRRCHRVTSAYDRRNSSSYEYQGAVISLEYGMGSARGHVGTETVEIGNMTVRKQAFVVVHRNSGFEGMRADGLLGLGFSRLADRNLTLVDNLYLQGLIPAPVFAIYLSDNDFSSAHTATHGSSISFGDWNLSQYSRSSEFTYLPVYTSTGYWAVPLKTVRLGDSAIAGTSFLAILDTGTSLLLGPASEVLSIFEYFSSRWPCHMRGMLLTCECANFTELPELKFGLGHDGAEFVLQPIFYTHRRNTTFVLLIDSFADTGLWILGDVFLRAYYSLFDMKEGRIGLAPSLSNSAGIVRASTPLPLIVVVLVVIALLVFGVVALVCCSQLRVPSSAPSRKVSVAETPESGISLDPMLSGRSSISPSPLLTNPNRP